RVAEALAQLDRAPERPLDLGGAVASERDGRRALRGLERQLERVALGRGGGPPAQLEPASRGARGLDGGRSTARPAPGAGPGTDGSGPTSRYSSSPSSGQSDSSIIRVSSSTKIGTPSVFATSWSTTSAGSRLPPARCSIIAWVSASPSRSSLSTVACGASIQV